MKEKLHRFIETSEDDIIAAVFNIFQTYNNTPEEKPEDIYAYNQEINDAMSEYTKGNYTLHEDVKKELRQL